LSRYAGPDRRCPFFEFSHGLAMCDDVGLCQGEPSTAGFLEQCALGASRSIGVLALARNRGRRRRSERGTGRAVVRCLVTADAFEYVVRSHASIISRLSSATGSPSRSAVAPWAPHRLALVVSATSPTLRYG
jgi:hypothetical protein